MYDWSKKCMTSDLIPTVLGGRWTSRACSSGLRKKTANIARQVNEPKRQDTLTKLALLWPPQRRTSGRRRHTSICGAMFLMERPRLLPGPPTTRPRRVSSRIVVFDPNIAVEDIPRRQALLASALPSARRAFQIRPAKRPKLNL